MSSKTICFVTTTSNQYCYNVVFLFHSFLNLAVSKCTNKIIKWPDAAFKESSVYLTLFSKFRTREALTILVTNTSIQTLIEIRNQKSENRKQQLEIRNQISEIRNQKSEIRNQISEIRYQKSDIRNSFCQLWRSLWQTNTKASKPGNYQKPEFLYFFNVLYFMKTKNYFLELFFFRM